MKRYLHQFQVIIFLLLNSIFLYGQGKTQLGVDYVKKYKDVAISQMQKYKIPASITLAQGFLESGGGMSELAKKANNHFGMKCSNWKGATYTKSRHECYRKYRKAEDSFVDHSLFLREKAAYARLFKLDAGDYKAWARGLYQCGYAADRNYAAKLIRIIEIYELYRYDAKKPVKRR